MRIDLAVPSIRQRKNYCGPASLSMVFCYHGAPISQNEIADVIEDRFGYTVSEEGTYGRHLMSVARAAGFRTQREYLDFTELETLLDDDTPVIISGNRRGMRHIFVARGYDDERQTVLVQDPRVGKLEYSHRDFLACWERVGEFGLLAYVVRP